MPTFDITERPVIGLWVDGTSAVYQSPDLAYDYAVGSMPFLSAASNEFPYERALAQVQKQQIDQSQQPGDQSLSGWWSRAYTDWTGGAGVEFSEPANDPRIQRSFWQSRGVNVWDEGKLSLLPEYVNRKTYTSSQPRSTVSGNYLYVGVGSTVDRHLVNAVTTAFTTTACTGFAGNALAMASGGGSVLLATDTSTGVIYAASSGGSAFSTKWTVTGTSNVGVWWVKQRALIASGNKLYARPVPAGTEDLSAQTPLFTHPDAGFVWTSVVESPNSILAAGYSDTSGSAVYRFTVDSTGALPTMSAALTTAETPRGEYILDMAAYLGSFIALVTNRGVRIGVIAGDGSVQYGPLTVEADLLYSGSGAVGWGQYLWTAGPDLGDGRPGLLRFDLGDVDDDGRAPYTNDVRAPLSIGGNDSILAGVVNGVLFFFARPTAGSWSLCGPDTSGALEGDGFVDSGWIRFGTLERKAFQRINLQIENPMYGRVVVSVIDEAGTEYTLTTLGDVFGADVSVPIVNPTNPQIRVKVRLTLQRDDTSAELGPVVEGWQVKAWPAVERQELIRLPLLCFDFVRDQNGQMFGYEGYALDQYKALRDGTRDGAVFRLQDLNTGENLTAVMDDLTFSMTAPPERASGFGGVLTLTARTT